jgi:acetyl-CoA carboxylase biotin carboxyl carrier protein
MFNALEAEFRGTVVDILVKPGDEVEAGQPLLRIE